MVRFAGKNVGSLSPAKSATLNLADNSIEYFSSEPLRCNQDEKDGKTNYLYQVNMKADPTADMQIATKHYVDGAIEAEKEKWELVQELTIAEDVSAVEFAPENLNQYKKFLLEFDMNHSLGSSGGLSANGREASPYWLWKFDYGNYMNQVGQILIAPSGISRAPTKIDGWGENNKETTTPSTFHIRKAENGLRNSRQIYSYESVFPCTKLRVWHLGTIVAGSIFVLWGCK